MVSRKRYLFECACGCLVAALCGWSFFTPSGLAEEPTENPSAENGQKTTSNTSQAPQAVIDAFNLGGCAGCHTIAGVPGATGQVGPDLSNLREIAASRREGMSAREYIRQSILEPDAFIAPDASGEKYPSGVMLKSFAASLSEGDLDRIVEYLADPDDEAPDQESKEPSDVSLNLARPVESTREPFKPRSSESADVAEIALGRYLFFDRRLSANNSLSCSSCHKPEKAFADGRALSRGYPSTKLFRNTPSLFNVGYQETFFRDGRIGDLPSVVRDHLTEAHFMASDGRLLIERLNQVPAYVEAFREVYDREPGFGGILDSLTAYSRSLNSYETDYDRFRNGQKNALSPKARAGLKLFRGKGGCVRCHKEPLLTDHDYHDLGVSKPADLLNDPERQVTFRRFFRVLGVPNYRNLRHDPGRGATTLSREDRGAFRTPMLREVARTGPYMHNGSLESLEDVVRFYNQGGGEGQTADLEPLGLTDKEVSQLVVFLESLSSPAIATEPPELPDYAVVPFGDGEDEEDGSVKNQKEPVAKRPRAETHHPPLGPLPDTPVPADNPITPAKRELGKRLFFDPRMSADGSTSCQSCHAVATGGTIRTPISMGGPGTSHWRNSQTILNVAYYGKLNWDGSKSSIESQNEGAWTGAVAGNLDPTLGEERLAQIPEYVRRFEDVFGTKQPNWEDALRAVATFERTLVSRNTPFDRYIQGDETAISQAARRGLELFRGKAECIACHNGPLASDDSYHALGVPQHPDFYESPLKQISFRYELAAKGVPRNEYRASQRDEGLYYVTKRPADQGKFRTPSLRGLVHTAPYMHNGVFGTLQDVVDFYNRGGGEHPNKSHLVHSLGLTAKEQEDLVEFLKTLSGEPLDISRPELPKYGRTTPNIDTRKP